MEHEPPGAVIAHYQIIRKLGAGGMGEVYLAEDTALSRRVAIKFLSPDRLPTADARARFLFEARAAAALEHPHICPVYEVDAAANPPFIVMQYVEGETLAQRLQRGPLSVDSAVRLGLEMADALGAAHARGIVHRDVKPHNIIITPSGAARLLDFGIAKRTIETSRDLSEEARTTVAATGLAGTPAYMAPEQVQQQVIDGRTDLFSLGAVLYECLTGRPAFRGDSLLELRSAIVHSDPPSPSSLRPELTPAHDELCGRLLAKAPADRLQSAAAVVTAIRELSTRKSGTGALLRKRQATSRRVAAAALIAAGLLGGTFYGTRTTVSPPVIAPQAQRWYDTGLAALQEGAWVQAIRALERATELDSRSALAWARLGEAQLELDQEASARESLLKASSLVPDRSSLPLDDRLSLEATMAMVTRDYPAALRARTELAARHPTSASVMLDLGRAHEARDSIAIAIEHYRRAAELDPENPAAHIRLGMLYGRQGQLDAALAAFARAESLYGTAGRVEGVATVLYQRAVAYDRADRVADAEKALSRARTMAESADSNYLRAAILLKTSAILGAQGQYDEAARAAREALDIGKGFEGLTAFGLVDLGNVFVYAGQKDRAAEYFTQAVERAQNARARRAEARARLALGALQMSRGETQAGEANATAALAYYQQAGFDGLQRTALTVLAAGQEGSGKLAAAQEAYESLLKLALQRNNPSHVAQQHYQLANVLLVRERYVTALEQCDKALAIYRTLDAPYDLAHSMLQKSDILWRLGRFADAERELTSMVERASAGSQTPEFEQLRYLRQAHVALGAGAAARAESLARDGLRVTTVELTEIEPLLHRAAALALARQGHDSQALAHVDAMERGVAGATDAVLLANVRLTKAEVLLWTRKYAPAFTLAAPLAATFETGERLESAWVAHTIASRAAAALQKRAEADGHAQGAARALRRLEDQLDPSSRSTWSARQDLQLLRTGG